MGWGGGIDPKQIFSLEPKLALNTHVNLLKGPSFAAPPDNIPPTSSPDFHCKLNIG